MRMWMINTNILCRKHLLGEHNEIHKHRHIFIKKHSIDGRIANCQIEPKSMELRHNELVEEMKRRGYNHNSPYEQPDITYLTLNQQLFEVNKIKALKDLLDRCPECSKRFEKNREW